MRHKSVSAQVVAITLWSLPPNLPENKYLKITEILRDKTMNEKTIYLSKIKTIGLQNP